MVDISKWTVNSMWEIVLDKQNLGLKYVYTGNLTSRSTSATYCKNCHRPVIVRNGYGLLEYNLDGGSCIFCGTKCDGRF